MTHKDLVEIAYKWLMKNGSVGVAFKELVSISDETPDVIGFDSWQSTLIEVKVSRSDFFADKKKPHRLKGMGNWRFYCCPKGMIQTEELPEKWGLIYVDEKGKARIEHDCRKKKVREECVSEWQKREHPEGFYYRWENAYENKFVADVVSERNIMYSALRRIMCNGLMKTIYAKDYKKLSVNEVLELNELANPL